MRKHKKNWQKRRIEKTNKESREIRRRAERNERIKKAGKSFDEVAWLAFPFKVCLLEWSQAVVKRKKERERKNDDSQPLNVIINAFI